MGPIERQYRLKRQKKRQRTVLFCLGSVLLLSFGAWKAMSSPPRYPWLHMPHGFYRPSLVETNNTTASTAKSLAPLPLQNEDVALRQKIKTVMAAYPKVFVPHFFYYNLQDHTYVDINGDKPVSAASVIKLPILLEYFKHVDNGALTPYTQIMYQNFEQAGGSGMTQYKPPGQPLIANDIATTMIQDSDNTCTNIMIYNMGGSQELDQDFQELGLNGTRINNWLPDLTGTNVISMKDMTKILYNIADTNILSQESRADALKIMEGTHNRRLLPALLPKSVLVAHKTGDIGTALGNVGLFILPNGSKYIIAMQVDRPFNDYRVRDMFQDVSKMIYDDVSSRPAIASSTSKQTSL